MATLKNPGSVCVARNVVRDLCVVDVFAVLGNVTADLFADRNLKPTVLQHLRPMYKGNPFHVRTKQRRLEQLADEFSYIRAQKQLGVMIDRGDYIVAHKN